jgi:hypothetical protein
VPRRSATIEPDGGTSGGFYMSPVALRSGYLCGTRSHSALNAISDRHLYVVPGRSIVSPPA